jgi:hypothetical protein
MRVPILVLSALAVAAPAMAQVSPQLSSPQLWQSQNAILLQQQESTRQQLVQQQNQLMSMEAQMRTQQALSAVQAQAQSPVLPLPTMTPAGALPQMDTSQLATIPDSVLADSNRRVLEATGNPH